MIETFGVLWLRPWWLALIPLAGLLGLALLRRARGLGGWERAIDPHLMARLRAMGRVESGGRGADWAAPALIAALGLALAGPAAERRDAPSYRNLDGVVLVVDISASTVGGAGFFDLQTTARLIAERAGARQTALIVYAGEAWLASAFTTDARAIGGAISLLGPGTAPAAGSRPEEALRLARRIIGEASILRSDVVLVTDGGGVGPAALAEARALSEAGATLSTIHAPGHAPGEDGAGALRALAAAGGGTAGDLVDPFEVAARIAAPSTERLAESGYAALVLSDLGRYLLLLALLPGFLLLPRRGAG